jgi:hypothetical protein
MKQLSTIFLIILINSSALAQTGSALVDSANSFHLFQTRDLKMDLKFIDPDKGSFGIDYELNLKRSLNTLSQKDSTLFEPNINLNLLSKGFLTVKGDANQFNSIVNELNFEVSPIFKQKKKPAFKEILPELEGSDEDIIEITRAQASMVSSPFWLMFNLHGKHEASQNFKSHDIAVGGTLSFTTSLFNGILDYPFGLLRVAKNNNPRQIDFSFVYDYVSGLNNTASKDLRESNNAKRVSVNVEWETGIFKNERISFLYNSFYELNAPLKIKQTGLDNNYYYQIKLKHRLSKSSDKTRKTVSIKYSQGELPPDFSKGYVLGAGFTLEF